MITVRKITRSLTAVMPGWLIVICGVCCFLSFVLHARIHHGTRSSGREPGPLEPAGLIVTSWLQGTSRDGDSQDHIHNQIARIKKPRSGHVGQSRDSVAQERCGEQHHDRRRDQPRVAEQPVPDALQKPGSPVR